MKTQDQNTRYIIDIDLTTHKIVDWKFDNKYNLQVNHPDPAKHRVFLTQGQYNKLVEKLEK